MPDLRSFFLRGKPWWQFKSGAAEHPEERWGPPINHTSSRFSKGYRRISNTQLRWRLSVVIFHGTNLAIQRRRWSFVRRVLRGFSRLAGDASWERLACVFSSRGDGEDSLLSLDLITARAPDTQTSALLLLLLYRMRCGLTGPWDRSRTFSAARRTERSGPGESGLLCRSG